MYRRLFLLALPMAVSEAWVTPSIVVTPHHSVAPLLPHRLIAVSASTVEPPPDASVKVSLPRFSESSTTVIEDDPAETSLPEETLLENVAGNDEAMRKVTNGILLAICFGYAAYTILNIDAHMTRGWTQSEIAMRIPLDNWSNYESSLEEKPIYTKTLINVVIYLLGDWLSQTVFQGKNVLNFDASRTLKNGFIGLCFGPLVHEYYQWSDHILPVDGPHSLMNRVEKIFMDQTIYLSVKASIYVAAVSLLAGESWDTAQSNVKGKIKGIVFTAWKFWPLVHCITYSVIPAQHRILWVNCVDLVWNAILASMSRTNTAEELEEQTALSEEPSQLGTSPEHESERFVLRQELVVPVATESIFDESRSSNNSTTAVHVVAMSNGTLGLSD